MTKLNQLIAVANTKKSEAQAVITKAYHFFQKPKLFEGHERTYQPKNDDDDALPPEPHKVQRLVDELLDTVKKPYVDMLDVVLGQDEGNTKARADVVVDGNVILSQVPVTSLLFLEKKLDELRKLFDTIPVLDISHDWSKDDNSNLYKAEPVKTHRTVKVSEPVVLAEPTEHHPAQVQLVQKDVLHGFWHTVRLSGAWTSKRKAEVLEKVKQLKEAVVKAREEANSTTVTTENIGEKLFGYILG